MTAIIGFLRELCAALEARADGWAQSSCLASETGGMGESFALRATILREMAGSIRDAMKRTLLA